MVRISRRNRSAGAAAPWMSRPVSEAVKINAISPLVDPVTVTPAGADGVRAASVHSRPSLSAR